MRKYNISMFYYCYYCSYQHYYTYVVSSSISREEIFALVKTDFRYFVFLSRSNSSFVYQTRNRASHTPLLQCVDRKDERIKVTTMKKDQKMVMV